MDRWHLLKFYETNVKDWVYLLIFCKIWLFSCPTNNVLIILKPTFKLVHLFGFKTKYSQIKQWINFSCLLRFWCVKTKQTKRSRSHVLLLLLIQFVIFSHEKLIVKIRLFWIISPTNTSGFFEILFAANLYFHLCYLLSRLVFICILTFKAFQWRLLSLIFLEHEL